MNWSFLTDISQESNAISIERELYFLFCQLKAAKVLTTNPSKPLKSHSKFLHTAEWYVRLASNKGG